MPYYNWLCHILFSGNNLVNGTKFTNFHSFVWHINVFYPIFVISFVMFILCVKCSYVSVSNSALTQLRVTGYNSAILMAS